MIHRDSDIAPVPPFGTCVAADPRRALPHLQLRLGVLLQVLQDPGQKIARTPARRLSRVGSRVVTHAGRLRRGAKQAERGLVAGCTVELARLSP
jgi:hypothetical protein